MIGQMLDEGTGIILLIWAFFLGACIYSAVNFEVPFGLILAAIMPCGISFVIGFAFGAGK